MTNTIVPLDGFNQAMAERVQILAAENQQLRKALKATRLQLNYLSQCREFGILTKAALMQQWLEMAASYPAYSIVFLDLDGLKAANDELGYIPVNGKIHRALNCVRATEIVGRWFSGDEFVLIVPTRMTQIILERLRASFAAEEMTFTAATGQCISQDLERCVEPLMAEVQEQKRQRVAA